jgi:hypothetical protein
MTLRQKIGYVSVIVVGIMSLPVISGSLLIVSVDHSLSSQVLIGLGLFLFVTKLIVSRSDSRLIQITTTGVGVFGKWVITGFLINTLTVVMGLLAIRWGGLQALNLFQSALRPLFEVMGVYGPVVLALFAAIGLLRTVRVVMSAGGWSLVRRATDSVSGVGYKRQFITSLIFAGVALVLTLLASTNLLLPAVFQYLVIPAAVASVCHFLATLAWLFIRPPWRESLAEMLWGAGLAVFVYVGLSGLSTAYLAVADLTIPVESRESLGEYVNMLAALGIWVSSFIVIDSILGVASMHLYNSNRQWFVDSVGVNPSILRSLWRSGALMILLTFVLVDRSGLLAIMVDIDFGGLAIAAYGMIGAVILGRMIELFVRSKLGVLISSAVTWVGIGIFAGHLLTSAPAIVQTLSSMPNLANFADGALPYANAVSEASWWLLVAVATVGVVRTARSIDVITGTAGVPTLLAVIGFTIVGWASWAVAGAFSELGTGFRLVGAIVLGATFGGSISLVATFFSAQPSSLMTHFASWLGASRFRAMNIGGFASAYVLIIRAALFDSLEFALLIEWIAIAVLSTYTARRIAFFGREICAPGDQAAPPQAWSRHDQSIDFVEETDLMKLTGDWAAFVDGELRPVLLSRVSAAMWESGRSFDDILKIATILYSRRQLENDSTGVFGLWRYLPLRRSGGSKQGNEKRETLLAQVIAVMGETDPSSISDAQVDLIGVAKLVSDGESLFVEESDQSLLVAASSVAAWGNGVDQSTIVRLLEPVANYSPVDRAWYRIGPLKKKWNNMIREERRHTADQLRLAFEVGGTG